MVHKGHTHILQLILSQLTVHKMKPYQRFIRFNSLTQHVSLLIIDLILVDIQLLIRAVLRRQQHLDLLKLLFSSLILLQLVVNHLCGGTSEPQLAAPLQVVITLSQHFTIEYRLNYSINIIM